MTDGECEHCGSKLEDCTCFQAGPGIKACEEAKKPDLEPAAAVHKSGDITKNLDNLEYPAFEGVYAASSVEDWFKDLLLGVEQAINEGEFEDHPWAFKAAMVELSRRDFEDLQNPEEAAEEVVQSLEVDT